MDEKKNIFKFEPVKITLGETEYTVTYDLNAFCELEKVYGSVDILLKMLLGTDSTIDTSTVTYNDAPVNASEIKIGNKPLPEFIRLVDTERRVQKSEDTLTILWAGLLHDSAIYNEHEEITGYSISKAKIGSYVTFRNLKEVNTVIVTAILRDLVPVAVENEPKNEEASKPILELRPVK